MTEINYGELFTERVNPRTVDIEGCSSLEIVKRINAEDSLVAQAVAACLPEISAAVDILADKLKNGGRLFYIGAGTSGRIGALDAFECPLTYGIEPDRIQAIVAGVGRSLDGEELPDMEDSREAGVLAVSERGVCEKDVVIGISASGTAPFVLAALEEGARRGAYAIGISNTPGSPLAVNADLAITAVTGPECITGSTRMKAGTAQKMILNMLSTAAMVRLGKVYQNLMVDMRASNIKLWDRGIRMVMLVTTLPRDSAASLLERSGDVKTALVMHECGCEKEAAHSLLAKADGFVSKAIVAGKAVNIK